MMYPVVEIKLNQIIDNVLKVKKNCEESGVKLTLVTKVLVDHEEIVKPLVENGIDCICESRIRNLKSYKDIPAEKWVIREPALCEIEDVIRYSDLSLNSERVTIQALNDEAARQGKVHQILLMYEAGDLREGSDYEELRDLYALALTLPNIKVRGIGTNYSCYGCTIPTVASLNELIGVAEKLEKEFGTKIELISGGNSTTYPLMQEGKLPARINTLRIGEGALMGTMVSYGDAIGELYHDNFILKAQIVELKTKPSVPWGEFTNFDSFGTVPHFEDKGPRTRALLNVGKQDVILDTLTPLDDKLVIMGASSDYMLIDVTDSDTDYKVGDVISFGLNYAGVLGVMNSACIGKEIIRG